MKFEKIKNGFLIENNYFLLEITILTHFGLTIGYNKKSGIFNYNNIYALLPFTEIRICRK
jgi:hypothetical protein